MCQSSPPKEEKAAGKGLRILSVERQKAVFSAWSIPWTAQKPGLGVAFGRKATPEELKAAASGDVYRDFVMFFLKIPVKVPGSLLGKDIASLFPPSKEKGSPFCLNAMAYPCRQGKISASGEIYRDSL